MKSLLVTARLKSGTIERPTASNESTKSRKPKSRGFSFENASSGISQTSFGMSSESISPDSSYSTPKMSPSPTPREMDGFQPIALGFSTESINLPQLSKNATSGDSPQIAFPLKRTTVTQSEISDIDSLDDFLGQPESPNPSHPKSIAQTEAIGDQWLQKSQNMYRQRDIEEILRTMERGNSAKEYRRMRRKRIAAARCRDLSIRSQNHDDSRNGDTSSDSSTDSSTATSQSSATMITGEKQKHYKQRQRIAREKSIPRTSRILVTEKDGDRVKYSIKDVEIDTPSLLSEELTSKTKKKGPLHRKMPTVSEAFVTDEVHSGAEREVLPASSTLSTDSWSQDCFLNLSPIARMRYQRTSSGEPSDSTPCYY